MTSLPPQPPELPEQPPVPAQPAPSPAAYPQPGQPPFGADGTVPHPSGLASTERSTAMWAWLTAILVSMFVCGLGFVGPLIILNTNNSRSSFIRAHAAESLNVQITVAIASLGAAAVGFLTLIGTLFVPFSFFAGFLALLLPLGVSVYGLVISIIGAVRANNGEMYRAPVAIRFVK